MAFPCGRLHFPECRDSDITQILAPPPVAPRGILGISPGPSHLGGSQLWFLDLFWAHTEEVSPPRHCHLLKDPRVAPAESPKPEGMAARTPRPPSQEVAIYLITDTDCSTLGAMHSFIPYKH
ncbi:uncharacterized protein LOC130458149 isoform X3 [Monodelphis domestica]|uniref:uncharacterized protein LOC130458149 isoform X3 n=1 Tax=Monodelphis domestica TaxID=13616 RepID=UPI0024E27723|nr:uncharacterized protein LOC130458149 isoform X3 [Monodelphis domestica]